MFILTKENRFTEFQMNQNIGIYSTFEKALSKVNLKEEDGKTFTKKDGTFIVWVSPEVKHVLLDKKKTEVYISYAIQKFEVDK